MQARMGYCDVMRSFRRKKWPWVLGTLLVTATAAVPIASLVIPAAHRHIMLGKLTSDDPDTRAAGHAYILGIKSRADNEQTSRWTDEYERLVAGAKERLTAEDDQAFIELVILLDRMGRWALDEVSIDAWLRWLAHVAKDADGEARLLAAQRLADLPQLAADPRVIEVFETLIHDKDAEVRYNVLVTAAEMWGAAKTQAQADAADRYARLIYDAAYNGHGQVAFHGYLFAGFVEPPSTPVMIDPKIGPPHPDSLDADLARLWFRAKTKAEDRFVSPDRWTPEWRAMGCYVAPMVDQKRAAEALAAIIKAGPSAVTKENQLMFWRAMLAMPLRSDDDDKSARNALVAFLTSCNDEDYKSDLLRPLILSCFYRDRELIAELARSRSNLILELDDPQIMLAMWEGVATAVGEARAKPLGVPITDQLGPALRLAALRAVAEPKIEDFIPLLLHESENIRDVGCITAIERLSKAEAAALIRLLWRPADPTNPDQPVYRYHNTAKMSGAILAGLSGAEPDLLARATQDFSKTDWAVHQVMQLGMWMQGQTIEGVDMAAHAPALLMRQDMPTSTVLLAMLHRKERLALDHLLTPRGDLNEDLLTLLDQFRWWHVLRHYLPADAPPFWLWADPDLQRFQLEVLRDWYVVNRYAMREGWGN